LSRSQTKPRRVVYVAAGVGCAVPLLLVILYWSGVFSGSGPASSGEGSSTGVELSEQYQSELFTGVVDNLGKLEQRNPGAELARATLARYMAWLRPAQGRPLQTADGLMETCPEPEMLKQIVTRLNQWVESQQAPPDWELDATVTALPESVRRSVALRDLDRLKYTSYDGFALREAFWMHDLSNWARGERLHAVDRAKRLFDWTVRNIQLDPEPDYRIWKHVELGEVEAIFQGVAFGDVHLQREDGTVLEVRLQDLGQDDVAWIGEHARPPQMAWETLFFGRGTAIERAWVFMLLCRQQRLDTAYIVLPPKPADPATADDAPASDPQDGQTARRRQAWAVVAVLIEGELYLFDPRLGLPIPAPDGIRLDRSGQLAVQPATLRQVLHGEAPLERLDLDAARPYPVSAADFRDVVYLLEASPAYLACRMRLIESQLPPGKDVVLTTNPTAQAQRISEAAAAAMSSDAGDIADGATNDQIVDPSTVDVQLWALSLIRINHRVASPPEWIILRLDAMLPFFDWRENPPGPWLRKARMHHLKGDLVQRRHATHYYLRARPSDREMEIDEGRTEYGYKLMLQTQDPDMPEEEVEWRTKQIVGIVVDSLHRGKQHASYWLGLIAFEKENYASAIDWFSQRTLAASAFTPWVDGATYNLARAYEATDEYAKAVALYESRPNSPSAYGNLLRARWLRAERPEIDKPSGEEPNDGEPNDGEPIDGEPIDGEPGNEDPMEDDDASTDG